MSFLMRTAITVAQIVVAFYGFWFVWRVAALAVPALPGPDNADERIAPYACYFTDPLVDPLTERLRLHPWLVSAVYLLLVAGAQVGLTVLTTFV